MTVAVGTFCSQECPDAMKARGRRLSGLMVVDRAAYARLVQTLQRAAVTFRAYEFCAAAMPNGSGRERACREHARDCEGALSFAAEKAAER